MLWTPWNKKIKWCITFFICGIVVGHLDVMSSSLWSSSSSVSSSVSSIGLSGKITIPSHSLDVNSFQSVNVIVIALIINRIKMTQLQCKRHKCAMWTTTDRPHTNSKRFEGTSHPWKSVRMDMLWRHFKRSIETCAASSAAEKFPRSDNFPKWKSNNCRENVSY